MSDQANENWQRLGAVEDLKKCALQQLEVGRAHIALSYRDGEFGAVSGLCNHAGGPLGQGSLKDDYIVCPWHNWMFHRSTGQARPGIAAAVPSHALRIQGGDLYIDLTPVTPRIQAPHAKHPLSRTIVREPGPLRVAGISTTAMNREFPRYSTSEGLLQTSLDHAKDAGMETRLIRLNDLRFRACEGYYSKSAHACTWPCTITQMDATDQLDAVYEALVFWADIVLIATPIRWGGPGSLYVKMTERLNCVQNQITLHNRVLIRNKVAAFIVVGGQDNVQAVVGQMMMFFGELGFSFPQFPFIAHSRGWSAEDMENHIAEVRNSAELHQGACELVDRCVELAGRLAQSDTAATHIARGAIWILRIARAHSVRPESAERNAPVATHIPGARMGAVLPGDVSLVAKINRCRSAIAVLAEKPITAPSHCGKADLGSPVAANYDKNRTQSSQTALLICDAGFSAN